MTAAGVLAFDPEVTFPTRWLVDLAPGVDLTQARRELGPTFGRTVLPGLRPDDVEYVATVAWMPYVMAALVAGFAVSTVGHVLVATIRRRRDLAILKTLGLGRGDVRAVVAWQATTLGIVALLVGLPVGVVTGRWAWTAVAARLGARSDPLVGPLLVVGIVVAAIVVLNAIAAVPGRMAARLRPAVVLRSE
jgi:putative ABC transport system permease protein